jgi:uncharacterized membrane protein
MKTNHTNWNRAAAGVTLAAAGAAAGLVLTRRRMADTRRALGGSRGIRVQESVTIARPAEELFGYWRVLENIPRVMSHVERVTELGGGRSHWAVKGPGGLMYEWDAEIVNEVPNRSIGWRSLPGSSVASAGSVTFRELDGRRTEVRVLLQYATLLGKPGDRVARLFGRSPSDEIREDLRVFKRRFEAGDAPTTHGPSRGAR